MEDFVFRLGLACLITHELDAVKQREWRFLFGLRRLPDEVASVVFILGHVPLLAVILALCENGDPLVADWSRGVLDIFCIGHALLHWHLRKNPACTFSSRASRAPIIGAAGLGGVHLFLMMRGAG
jgi:hypothetical protein